MGVEEANSAEWPRDPAVHNLLSPQNSDLLKWLETLGFELSFKELFW